MDIRQIFKCASGVKLLVDVTIMNGMRDDKPRREIFQNIEEALTRHSGPDSEYPVMRLAEAKHKILAYAAQKLYL